MITPRRTRLLRAPTLQSFQHAIAEALRSDADGLATCAVLVPSRAAAEQLRRTLKRLAPDAAEAAELLTREGWYRRMHARLGDVPAMLSGAQREALLADAARHSEAAGVVAPFVVRPGLVAEMLSFYDALSRQQRTLDDFERLAVGELEASAAIDHGAARMLQQTRFLVDSFRRFEQQVQATGRLDEHELRRRLLAVSGPPPFQHVVVTVADQTASGDGLWLADFDLMARMPRLKLIDVVSTEARLAGGYHERIHDLFPGIEEERVDAPSSTPELLVPAAGDGATYFTSRDREEELWAFAHRLKTARSVRAKRAGGGSTGAVAVVFQRPLPYIYLAEQVLEASTVDFETFHGLPLAAEPYAALVDLVFEALASGFAREPLVALLRSPHLRVDIDGARPAEGAVAHLDRWLQDSGYVGGRDRLTGQLAAWRDRAEMEDAHAVAAGAAALVDALAPIEAARTAVEQWSVLLDFLSEHEAPLGGRALDRDRQERARAAILDAIREVRSAVAPAAGPAPVSDLRARFRRRLETELFERDHRGGGVQLVDAATALYGRFAEVHVVGLIEGEWPAGARRNVFYPASLLRQLGWPVDADRTRAARARFADLVALPTDQVVLSTIQLEADALVAPSTLLEEVAELGLPTRPEPPGRLQRVSLHEMLSAGPLVPSVVGGELGDWLAARRQRAEAPDRFGSVGALAPRRYAVSRVERHLACPFKYFCIGVLGLKEEVDQEPTLSRRGRGELLHTVLRKLVDRWRAAGYGGFAAEKVDAVLALAEDLVEEELRTLPAVDRQLERARLLGSAAGIGLVERLVRLEAERSGDVVESQVERVLAGEFVLTDGAGAARRVRIRGVADRLDLLADGSLRVIDYKLGRAPRPGHAVQLPIYATCAEQALEGYRRRSWKAREASYVAFGGSRLAVPVASDDDPPDTWLAEGQSRFLGAVDEIERGEFPARPAEDRLCASCGFAAVCRKGRTSAR